MNLTQTLESLTDDQPFVPNVDAAWVRGTRRRHRRRAAVAVTSAVAVVAVSAAAIAAIGAWHAPLTARQDPGAYAASPGLPGQVDFTVQRLTGPNVQVACAAEFVLTQEASTLHVGGQPCEPLPTGPVLGPPQGRPDDVFYAGRKMSLFTGTAPEGTVAVTAEDEQGLALTASLRKVPFSRSVFFAFLTPRRPLLHLNYQLADGRTGVEQQIDETDN